MKTPCLWAERALVALSMSLSSVAWSASGEMGTGKPFWGSYSAQMHSGALVTIVWNLGPNPVIPFAAGCPYITLTSSSMSMDGYKAALALMLQAKALGQTVRFVAHAERDWGCGADYVAIESN